MVSEGPCGRPFEPGVSFSTVSPIGIHGGGTGREGTVDQRTLRLVDPTNHGRHPPEKKSQKYSDFFPSPNKSPSHFLLCQNAPIYIAPIFLSTHLGYHSAF